VLQVWSGIALRSVWSFKVASVVIVHVLATANKFPH